MLNVRRMLHRQSLLAAPKCHFLCGMCAIQKMNTVDWLSHGYNVTQRSFHIADGRRFDYIVRKSIIPYERSRKTFSELVGSREGKNRNHFNKNDAKVCRLRTFFLFREPFFVFSASLVPISLPTQHIMVNFLTYHSWMDEEKDVPPSP